MKILSSALIYIIITLTTATAFGQAVYRSSFNETDIKAWQPYGDGCRVSPGTETGSIAADYDNSSNVAWSNKGFQRSFPDGLDWGRFKYLTFKFRVTEGIDSIHCMLNDKKGNWWKIVKQGPIEAGVWTQFACKKKDLVFAWSDIPDVKSAENIADVCGVIICTSTFNINTNTKIRFELKDIEIGSNAPALIVPEPPPVRNTKAIIPAPTPFKQQWKVTSFNGNGNMVVDGKPFFPLGLYSCIGIDEASGTYAGCLYTGGVTESDSLRRFRDIKNAGFNLLQTYTMQFYGMKVSGPGWTDKVKGVMIEDTTPEKVRLGTIKFLNLCQKAGLKALIGGSQPYSLSVPLPVEGRERALEAIKEQLRANMSAWKNHPSLIAWYLHDEPAYAQIPVQDMQDIYRFMKTQDTRFPIFFPSSSPTDVQYRYTADVIAPDPYPVEQKMPLHSVAHYMDMIKAGQTGNPPMPQVWAVIQIGQWVENIREPSVEEIRLLAMLALTRDAKGLMFYSHNSFPERNPKHWQDITTAVKSLHTLFPYLLENSIVTKDYKCSDPRIDSILRKGKGKYTLIAVNSTQNVVFDPIGIGKVAFDLSNRKLPAGTKVSALDEDPQCRLKLGSQRQIELTRTNSGYVLTDTFPALAVHVYLIKLPKEY